MAENSPDAEVGEGFIAGRHGRTRSDVRAGIRVDTSEISKLKGALTEAKNITEAWRKEMEKLSKAAAEASGHISSANGGQVGGNAVTNSFAQITKSEAPAQQPAADGDGVGAARRYLATNASGGGMAKAAGGLAAFTQALQPLMQAINSRIERGTSYATSADRLNVLTQQMTGMSQMQVMSQVRAPLAQYRLGAGGINAMQQFQAQIGTQLPGSYAQSVAGIRTLTGYSKSTSDILAEQQQLMSPEVANRMFFMGGTNAFNIGGGLKDPLQMRQEIIKKMGLDNPATARSALMPGSVTRARLADMGLGEEMQTEILQYAQSQISFREKGGQGMYDPTSARDRQLMGVEENLATQQEETARTSAQREESFMRRQIDNMAQYERVNQRLIEALGSLEDTLSGLVGAKTSFGGAGRAVGGAATVAGMGILARIATGAATGAMGGPAGIAIGAGLGLLGGFLGDPANPEAETGTSPSASNATGNYSSSANDSNITVPYGYNGNRVSLTQLKNSSNFKRINPKFQDRLLRMMRANPEVGIGGGYRDPSEQEKMFLSRYQPTEEETDIFWDGKYWKHVSGAAAAPPGMSMHEIGLAVDMVGDLEWMNANAGKFGLKHFANVNNEPWHVQPSDLPNSRRKYEKEGAPWGTDGKSSSGSGPNARYPSEMAAPMGDSGHTADAGTAIGMGQATISGRIAAHKMAGRAAFLGASGAGNRGAASTGRMSPRGRSLRGVRSRQLTGEEVARFAYNAGFRGEDLVRVVAIAKRESSWQTGAYNPDRSTGDDSYGLMQINMLGALEAERLQKFSSFGVTRKEDLYDPEKNMQAAYSMYLARDRSLYDWGEYKGEENTYNTDISGARAVVESAGLSGDPIIDMGRSRSGRPAQSSQGTSTTNHFTSSPTINVAPVINFNGAPGTPDLKRIAQTVSRMIKEEVDMLDLRNA